VTERRFGELPLEAMSSDQREVADAILAGPRSMSTGLRGPFEPLLHSPKLAMAAQELGAQIRFHSSLPGEFNEMAILMTARRWTAQYEWHAHRQLALDAGLDPAIADAIAVGDRPELDPAGAAVYDFTSQLLESGHVTDEAWDAVVGRWGKTGAVELIGAVGYYCLVSFVLNVDRYPIPDGGRDPLDPLP
jgi:4-carboxymuconolactone decarboxylase